MAVNLVLEGVKKVGQVALDIITNPYVLTVVSSGTVGFVVGKVVSNKNHKVRRVARSTGKRVSRAVQQVSKKVKASGNRRAHHAKRKVRAVKGSTTE